MSAIKLDHWNYGEINTYKIKNFWYLLIHQCFLKKNFIKYKI